MIRVGQLLKVILLMLAPFSVLSANNVTELGVGSMRLRMGTDAATFFRNSEYHSNYQLGYTLPG